MFLYWGTLSNLFRNIVCYTLVLTLVCIGVYVLGSALFNHIALLHANTELVVAVEPSNALIPSVPIPTSACVNIHTRKSSVFDDVSYVNTWKLPVSEFISPPICSSYYTDGTYAQPDADRGKNSCAPSFVIPGERVCICVVICMYIIMYM